MPAAAVELGGTGAGMIGHGRGGLQRPAIPEISRDPRRPKTMIAHLGLNSGRRRAPADHGIGVGLGQGGCGSAALCRGRSSGRAAPGIFAQPAPIDIGVQVRLQIVMAGTNPTALVAEARRLLTELGHVLNALAAGLDSPPLPNGGDPKRADGR